MPDPPLMHTRSLGILTRRPAAFAAVFLVLGILLHEQIQPHPKLLLFLSTGTAFLCIVTVRTRIVCAILICVLITLLGVILAQREHFQFAPNDIGLFATDEPHLTQIEARLIDEPQIVAGPVNAQRLLPPKQITIAQVLRLKTWDGWTPVTGRLPVQINQPNPDLMAGQTVRMLGMLQRPRAAMNPGEFDWAVYYRQQRILANFTVNRVGNIRVLSRAGLVAARLASKQSPSSAGYRFHRRSRERLRAARCAGAGKSRS